MIIKVYRHCGTWAFTDKARELVHEPFVAGIPEIIDHFVSTNGTQDQETHSITFSGSDFPGSQGVLQRGRPESGGFWYHFMSLSKTLDGWLCPATLKYFNEHPEHLFVSVN